MSILKNFTVVDLVKTRSASVVTLSENALKFNNQTTAELHYAPFVQVLVNPKEKQFAIRACKEGDLNAVPFSKPAGEQKYPIKVTSSAIIDMVRKMATWPAEENRNIPGIYFADEEAIVYDMKTAFVPGPPRGGWKRKKETEAAEKND